MEYEIIQNMLIGFTPYDSMDIKKAVFINTNSIVSVFESFGGDVWIDTVDGQHINVKESLDEVLKKISK